MVQQAFTEEEILAQIFALRDDVIVPPQLWLLEQVCTIGRSPSCQIMVRFPQVSRIHARIERESGRYALADAGSANGTYLNGIRIIERTLLKNDDVIGLGASTPLLKFVDPESTLHSPGVLRFDERALTFYLSGMRLDISPMQLRLLRYLYEHANYVCSRESCAQAIWGRDYEPGMDAGALDQAFNSLRRAIRQVDPRVDLIETRRGLGYILHL